MPAEIEKSDSCASRLTIVLVVGHLQVLETKYQYSGRARLGSIAEALTLYSTYSSTVYTYIRASKKDEAWTKVPGAKQAAIRQWHAALSSHHTCVAFGS